MGFRPGQFPQAEAYYAEAISIPLYAGLTDADQDRVVLALERALA
jgi:dTDP-4-amino-4,6-dideoxygalactose transaminase